MTSTRNRNLPALVALAASAAFVGASPSRAPADTIVLRGGGQLRGKVVADPKRPDRVAVLTERGKTPLSLLSSQIARIDPVPGPLDGYVTRRQTAPATAKGQFDLGVWCERNALADLAVVHYEAALAADKSFAPAHQKLGHVRYEGRWLGGDELREAQGLVRDRGRWVTREEKEQREKETASAAEQGTWARRIRLLRDAYVSGADDRRREAEVQLMSLREPAAVRPLVQVLGRDSAPVRSLLARVLGATPGREASTALAHLLLGESDPDVRHTVMDELRHRGGPEVTRLLARALRADSPEVVNRAAWGLANLKAVAAVPSLVGALVTSRPQNVLAPAAGGPAEGPAITATFGAGPVAGSPYGAPIAYNGSTIGYLNGAAVGPGAVAFGASAVPLGPLPSMPSLPGMGGPSPLAGIGINAGGGLNGSRGPTPRVVSTAVHNVEVLAALVALTGEDFGYDVDAWRRWVRTSFRPDPTPARVVPQP